jgi:UDP-N-acetylmuramyl pentapeptide phosphotransferase/UDP-N-acetylglucosamine-1-phosphate transferase
LIPAIAHAVIIPPLLALLASWMVVALLIRTGVASLALDYPNQRSLHVTPTPRLGGIGIAAGVAAAWGYSAAAIDPLLLLALALLIGVSLLDDLKGVRVVSRFVIHLVSALLAVIATLRGDAWWAVAVAVLATAWMINLYNFMDGADGLAGGMTVIGFGSYGIAALAGGDFSFAALNLSVAMAALGFLFFNFPPARVFMGDVGTIPLGCLAAVFDIAGSLRGNWPWWFGILVFSPFIVDASLTLGKRLLRGALVWQAHREHYYQRLVQSGWGHKKTACAEYALMLLCSLLGIISTRMGGTAQIALLFAVASLYAGLIVAVERHFPGHGEA